MLLFRMALGQMPREAIEHEGGNIIHPPDLGSIRFTVSVAFWIPIYSMYDKKLRLNHCIVCQGPRLVSCLFLPLPSSGLGEALDLCR